MKRKAFMLFLSLFVFSFVSNSCKEEVKNDTTDGDIEKSESYDTDIDTLCELEIADLDTSSELVSEYSWDREPLEYGEWEVNADTEIAYRYYRNADGSISDIKTGLTWFQNKNPQWYFTPETQTYYFCREQSFGGVLGWRVPSILELRSLLKDCPENEISGSCTAGENQFVTLEELSHCQHCPPRNAGSCYWSEKVWHPWCGKTGSSTSLKPTGLSLLDFKTGILSHIVYPDCDPSPCDYDENLNFYVICVHDGVIVPLGEPIE